MWQWHSPCLYWYSLEDFLFLSIPWQLSWNLPIFYPKFIMQSDLARLILWPWACDSFISFLNNSNTSMYFVESSWSLNEVLHIQRFYHTKSHMNLYEDQWILVIIVLLMLELELKLELIFWTNLLSYDNIPGFRSEISLGFFLPT